MVLPGQLGAAFLPPPPPHYKWPLWSSPLGRSASLCLHGPYDAQATHLYLLDHWPLLLGVTPFLSYASLQERKL